MQILFLEGHILLFNALKTRLQTISFQWSPFILLFLYSYVKRIWLAKEIFCSRLTNQCFSLQNGTPGGGGNLAGKVKNLFLVTIDIFRL